MSENAKLLKSLLDEVTYDEIISTSPDLSVLSKIDITILMAKKHARDDIDRLFCLGLKMECGHSDKIPFEFYEHFNMNVNDVLKEFRHYGPLTLPSLLNFLVNLDEEPEMTYLFTMFERNLDDEHFDMFVRLDQKYSWSGNITWKRFNDRPVNSYSSYQIIDVLLMISIKTKRIFRYLVDKYKHELNRPLLLAVAVNRLYVDEVEYLIESGFTFDNFDDRDCIFDPLVLSFDSEQTNILKKIIDMLFDKFDTEFLVSFFRDFVLGDYRYCPNCIITSIVSNIHENGYGYLLKQ